MECILFRGRFAMDTAKLFVNGKSQAVRLPKEYRFSDDEVYIRKIGEVVYLFPKTSIWNVFMDGLNGFSDDFMAEGRDQGEEKEQELL
jgi:antitoxin VapB